MGSPVAVVPVSAERKGRAASSHPALRIAMIIDYGQVVVMRGDPPLVVP